MPSTLLVDQADDGVLELGAGRLAHDSVRVSARAVMADAVVHATSTRGGGQDGD